MTNQEQLNNLQLKRATLLSQLEMLSSASPESYQKSGKVQADIYLLKRKIIRETQNPLDEN